MGAGRDEGEGREGLHQLAVVVVAEREEAAKEFIDTTSTRRRHVE